MSRVRPDSTRSLISPNKRGRRGTRPYRAHGLHACAIERQRLPHVHTNPRPQALTFMLIAGETSGDILAAELIKALRATPAVRSLPFAPRFFGAGGPRMAAAGAEVVLDLSRHAVVGLSEVARKYFAFRRCMQELLETACARQPDMIIGVDFSGFNLRFVRELRARLERLPRPFCNWRPRVAQYVSPQVWASRPGRARRLTKDLDLLLCLYRFEKDWYARHAKTLNVEFTGHPMVDRHAATLAPGGDVSASGRTNAAKPNILLLPGSRVTEVRRHLPVMLETARRLNEGGPARVETEARPSFTLVFPNESLMTMARPWCDGLLPSVERRIGGLGEALTRATVAIACTGTVTLECALHGVPTVTLYKTSWTTYLIARHLVTVKYLTMPNLLAGEELFPEFIQHRANPANLARATRAFLDDVALRESVRKRLGRVVEELGPPGAAGRAAAEVARLVVGE